MQCRPGGRGHACVRVKIEIVHGCVGAALPLCIKLCRRCVRSSLYSEPSEIISHHRAAAGRSSPGKLECVCVLAFVILARFQQFGPEN